MAEVDNELVAKALEIATKAHDGQKRWSGEPYINHPLAVAALVRHLGPKYEAAALLHDAIEDTAYRTDDSAITAQKLLSWGIPDDVVSSVCLLTHAPDESYLTYVLALKTHTIARAVKLADIEHNLNTSDVFMDGYRRLLRTKWQMARWIIEN